MSDVSETFNSSKIISLLVGTIGIYSSYFAIGLMQQRLLKIPYQNIILDQPAEYFKHPIFSSFVPSLISFIIGSIYNKIKIPQEQKVVIPHKNSIMCALFVLIGGLTFNYAILWTNYPIVVTVKSCNIVSVILVSILCSRVKQKKLKLSPKKIIVGVIATLGIIIFRLFDPQSIGNDNKFQIMGFAFLFISVLVDGFLPDFQAQIKSRYKPQPTQMMVAVNKWVCIFSAIYIVISGSLIQPLRFILSHESVGFHLLALGIFGTIGQLFIYRMIKQFKQHIVPFLITTRKLLTVGISILFYHHQTQIAQIVGMFVVFSVVIYEFVNQIYQSNKLAIAEQISPQNSQTQTKSTICPSNQVCQASSNLKLQSHNESSIKIQDSFTNNQICQQVK